MSSTLGGGLLKCAQPQQQRRHSITPCRATSTPVREVLEEGSSSFGGDIPAGLNKFSGKITQPKSQGASQAMLYATGLVEADLQKPQVHACMPGCADGIDDGMCWCVWRGSGGGGGGGRRLLPAAAKRPTKQPCVPRPA